MSESAEFYEGLENMSVKGGSDIGVVAAAALRAYAFEISQNNPQYYELIEQYGERLKALKPTMASVHNIVDQIIGLIQETDITTPEGRKALITFVDRYKAATEEALQEIAQLFANIVVNGDVILTHSFTKSALYALENAAQSGKRFSVICTESRPLCEGAYLATRLASLGIQATVITDAAMAHYLPRCTKVIVGADALYTDGTIVNKMGTLPVAILARTFNKPVYALAITSKLYMPSRRGLRLELESRPETEVMDRPRDGPAGANLKVENIFFEEVPEEYVTYLVTEKGLLKPSQLLEAARD